MDALPPELKLTILQHLIRDYTYKDALSLASSSPSFFSVFSFHRNVLLSTHLRQLSHIELYCCHLLARAEGFKFSGDKNEKDHLPDPSTILKNAPAATLWDMIHIDTTIRSVTDFLCKIEKESPLLGVKEPVMTTYLYFTSVNPFLLPHLLQFISIDGENGIDSDASFARSFDPSHALQSGESDTTKLGKLIWRTSVKLGSSRLVKFEEMCAAANGGMFGNMVWVEEKREELKRELLARVREAQVCVFGFMGLVRGFKE
jgi:hypothetical protein